LTLPFAEPFVDFITWFRGLLGLTRGYEAGIGIGIALLVASISGTIANSYYNRMSKGIEQQVTHFMRDLTEARKTGSSQKGVWKTSAAESMEHLLLFLQQRHGR